jgi:ligand-binding sensor domain-containing protein
VVAQATPLPAADHLRGLVARAWGVEEGLPQEHVPAIAQTADGFIWVGTQEGLARFDGIGFDVLSTRNCPAFHHSRVYALAEDLEGALWAGTAAGLVRIADGETEGFTTAQGLSNNSVQALSVDRDGRLWVGTRAGLDRIEGRLVVPVGAELGLGGVFVTALATDPRSGTVWVGTRGAGLYRVDGGTVAQLTTADGLPDDQVNALALDREGRLWIATFDGLGRLEGGRLETLTEEDGLCSRRCQGLAVDGDGSLWVGTANAGLCRLHNGRFSVFSEEDGLSERSVASILRDREGNLWVGTLGGGLNRLQSYGLTFFGSRDGLSSDMVSAVLEDSAGRIWAGTWEDGLNLLEDGRVRRFHVGDGLPDEAVQSLAEDRRHTIWVGTRNGGMARFDGSSFVPLPLPGRPDVRVIREDRAGTLWIGTYGDGVYLRRGAAALERLTRAQGLCSDFVVTLAEDRTGAMWVGSDGSGVSRLVEGRVIAPPASPELATAYVRAIVEDDAGTLWIGTSGNGLFRWRDGEVTRFTEQDGLWSDKIFAIFARPGELWLTCNRGVFRVRTSALDDFARGRAQAIPCDVFGREPGVGNLECNGGYTPAGWPGRDGRLWFGTVAGLAALDPTRVEPSRNPPLVAIEGLEVDRQSVPLDEEVQVGRGVQRVSVRYVGLHYTAPRSVSYRYRLDGLENDWVEAGTRREVNYTNLPPGRYRFLVEACAGADLCSTEPAALGLVIAAPFWRAWWFLALSILAAAALLYSFGKWRQVLAQRRERERMEVVRQLTVGVLHELRQPLQVIHSRLEILRLRPGELEAGLGDIFIELGRLRGLLGQLEELQLQPFLRTASYARDDTMVDLSREPERDDGGS